MAAPWMSVGEHPHGEPDLSYPCAECVGERARQAIHDHFYDIKYDDSIPERARCEFEEKFGDVIVKMAAWAYEYATDVALRNDNDPCEMHAPSKSDEE